MSSLNCLQFLVDSTSVKVFEGSEELPGASGEQFRRLAVQVQRNGAQDVVQVLLLDVQSDDDDVVVGDYLLDQLKLLRESGKERNTIITTILRLVLE